MPIKVLIVYDNGVFLDRRVEHQLEVLKKINCEVTFLCPQVSKEQISYALPVGIKRIFLDDINSLTSELRLKLTNLIKLSDNFFYPLKNIRNKEGRVNKWGVLFLLFQASFFSPKDTFSFLKTLLLYFFKKKLPNLFNRLAKQKIIKDLKEINFEPTHIHVHDLCLLSFGVDLKNYFNCKLFYDSHEIYFQQFQEGSSQWNHWKRLENTLIGSVDLLISVNQYCIDVISSEHQFNGKTKVLSNAVKLIAEDEGGNPKTSRLSIIHDIRKSNKNSKILIFQGGLNPLRNIDELLAGFSFLSKDYYLILISFPMDCLIYQKKCKELEIDKNVYFLCDLKWQEVISIAENCDAGIIPYQLTSLNAFAATPNKMYEFFAAGVPIIANNKLERVQKLILENKNGYTGELTDGASYGNLIREAFAFFEKNRTKLKKALRETKAKYNYRDEEQTLIDIYLEK